MPAYGQKVYAWSVLFSLAPSDVGCYTSNIVLGGDTFAYVPGESEMELPVGDVLVELNKSCGIR
jgi:hypothetical protein